jgi:DNA modification methylase
VRCRDARGGYYEALAPCAHEQAAGLERAGTQLAAAASQILKGDARHLPLPDASVDCIVTSPPYWGQRDYHGPKLVWGIENRKWKIENRNCRHRWGAWERGRRKDILPEALSHAGRLATHSKGTGHSQGGRFCRDCGAWRGQLGLEATPELYVQHLVEIFREARRVLKPTGTCWLVISDSRPSGNRKNHGTRIGHKQETDAGCLSTLNSRPLTPDGLKYSDMLGLPHDLVKALRADGWYWRDEIIWAKPNGFCESVRTRVTRNHEYIFLLTKSPSPKYFFDVEAIMEPAGDPARRLRGRNSGYAPPGQSPSRGIDVNPHPAFRRLGREGVNSRMHQDRDVFHPAARKRRNVATAFRPPHSGNKERLIGGRARIGDHLGFNVPWEGLYRRKRSVWTVAVSKPRGLKHYATFPEKLIEPMILAGCPRGGVVLDFFAGSGTTGVVARRLGRRFILIDLAYQEMQRRRLNADG